MKVGDSLQPSLERIIAFGRRWSDLNRIAARSFHQQFQDQNIAAFVTDPHDLDGVFRSIDRSHNSGQDGTSGAAREQLRERVSSGRAGGATQIPVCFTRSQANHFTQLDVMRLSRI